MNMSFLQRFNNKQEQGGNLGPADKMVQDSPGMRLGQGMHIDPAHVGAGGPMAETMAQMQMPGNIEKIDKTEKFDQPSAGASQTLGATFANEVMRRMGETDGENGQTKDNSDLRHSLGQTMDWVRERFGDETAAAAAGMVLQSTSSEVNEETLGDGLLNTLKFIDRNFGVAAGDAAISQFNNGANSAINDYFDNGKAEVFYATPAPDANAPSATQDINTRLFMRSAQDFAAEGTDAESLTEQLLNELKKELDEVAELTDLTTQLEDLSPSTASMQTAMAAYAQPPVPAEPQFADIAV